MSFLIPKVRESFRNNELDKIFEDLFAGYDEFFSDTRYKDAEDNLVLEVECPGFNKNNLNVEIADGVLIVQGTREGKNKKELYKRFTVGKTFNHAKNFLRCL